MGDGKMSGKKFQGERLKNARQLRGLTLTALAEQTGISKQSISQYENGDTRPEHERGFRLASVLNVPYDFFLTEDAYKAETHTTYFRSLASSTKLARNKESLKLEYVAKLYEALEQYIDFPTLNLPAVNYSGGFNIYDDNDCIEMYNELEEIALAVRKHWELGVEPIRDIQFILESNGIVVTGFETDTESIDAFSQRTIINDEEICFIAVDQGRKPEGRIRFDLAHELAHLLIHPWSEDIDSLGRVEFKTREFEANFFASAFLLPKESFGKDVQAYPTDLQYYLWLKKKWKSSVQSMVFRANQLHYISNSQFQYLMRQISKNGWRKKEPDDTPFVLGENIFQGAIDLLIDGHILTVNDLLNLFSNYGAGLYPAEIEDLLHLNKGTLEPEGAARIISLRSDRKNI